MPETSNKNDKIFDAAAKKYMISWDFAGFKRRFPRLYKAILTAMDKKSEEDQENKKKLFWKESAKLIDSYRKDGDDRAAEGVVSCRILFNRIFNNA